MRVLTLNVQNDQGDPRRTGLLNRELCRLVPDLVAMQEVCYPAQLAELLAGTGLRYTTHQTQVLDTPVELARHGGTAVATRVPHRVLDVVEGRAGELHWWTLAVAVGEVLFVVPTTPWQPGAEAVRQRQAVEVADLCARYRRSGPTIVAGDLNADPSERGVRYLSARFQDAWTAAGDGPGHTWSVDNPLAAAEIQRLFGDPTHRRRIDYVFVGSGHVRSARLVCDRPVEGVWLTDHAAVLVEL